MKLFVKLSFQGLIAVVVLSAMGLAVEPTGSAGKIDRDVWYGIGDIDLETFRSTEKFYSVPSASTEIDGLVTPSYFGDLYAQRLRGRLTAPVSGSYRFWLYGDDEATLWLGENGDKFSKVEIAKAEKKTAAGDVTRFPSQASAPITLQAGQRYYLEIQHRNRYGSDSVGVAWSYVGAEGLVNWTQESGVSASQSATRWGGDASRAIDGDTNSLFDAGSVTHTADAADSWWQVDLGQSRTIDRVEIFNRFESGSSFPIHKRLTNFRLSILDVSGGLVASKDYPLSAGHVWLSDFWEAGSVQGRFVRIELLGPGYQNAQIISLAEVKVWGRDDPSTSFQSLEPLPPHVLESYAGSLLDADDDNLPDAWEGQFGFDSSSFQSGNFSPARDPDKDGLLTVEESTLGTDPFKGDSIAGRLTSELWSGLAAYDVSDLIHSDLFFSPPAVRSTCLSSSFREIVPNSGARLRGYLTAPTSGSYHFWLSSRDGAELWLSSDDSKYRKRRLAVMGAEHGTGHGIPLAVSNRWDHFASQLSESVYLEAGQKYFLEVLTQQGHTSQHVSLAWAYPGQAREPIPASVLNSYIMESEDSDDDYLPDAWELQFGLDITDNGLINRDQQGERGDLDLDGLSNRHEFLAGTDPSNPDTDGDGLNDAAEVRAYGTDPTVSDAPSESLLNTIDLSSYQSDGPQWTLTSTGLVPASFRGSLRWDFSVPTSGYWTFNIVTKLLGDLYQHELVDLELLIDGQSIGDYPVAYGLDRIGLLRVISPLLAAGTHTLELKIDNVLARRMVAIQEVFILEPLGADLDGDGFPDWVISALSDENSLKPFSALTQTSPAFLEGHARIRNAVTLNGQPVLPGMDHDHWYANVPLSESGVTPFELLFPDGLSQQASIQWQPTNIFEQGSIMIRRGDSIKLTAQPLGGASGQPVSLYFSSSRNFARDAGVTASQSTTGWGGVAARAIDGNSNGNWAQGSVTHTLNQPGSWWQLDLGQLRSIDQVRIWSRLDAPPSRLSNFRVSALDSSGSPVAFQDFYPTAGAAGVSEDWHLASAVNARFIKIEFLGANHAGNYLLSLAEVEVFGNEAAVDLASDTMSHPHRFDIPGTQVVTAIHSTGGVAEFNVVVKQASFHATPQDLLSNTVGTLSLPRLAVDQGLYFEGGQALVVAPGVAAVTSDHFQLSVLPHERGAFRLLARLHEDGPILDTKPLNLIGISDALQNDLQTSFLSRDFVGYNQLSVPIVATDLPPGGQVVVRIFRSGVTFLDGTKTRVFQISDFVNDTIILDFLFPIGMSGGYCHHLDIYDRNGAFLGRR